MNEESNRKSAKTWDRPEAIPHLPESEKQEAADHKKGQQPTESDQRSDEQVYRLGFEAGRSFALEIAEADQLERLAEVKSDIADSEWTFADHYNVSSESLSLTPSQVMFGDIYPGVTDEAAIPKFWDSVTRGQPHPVDDMRFQAGFLDGAVETWEEVHGRLPADVRRFPDLPPIPARAIERLRASKKRCIARARQEGTEAGERYAMHTANAYQLDHLRRLAENIERSYLDFGRPVNRGTPHNNTSCPSAEQLFYDLHPTARDDKDASESFWASVTNGAGYFATNRYFLEAFVRGAAGVWREVLARRSADAVDGIRIVRTRPLDDWLGASECIPISFEVTQRLHESERRCDEEAERMWHEAGRWFAVTMATADELERLQKYLEQLDRSGESFLDNLWMNCEAFECSPFQLVYEWLRDTEHSDDQAVNAFFDGVTNFAGRLAAKDRFLEKFERGAVEIWREAQAQFSADTMDSPEESGIPREVIERLRIEKEENDEEVRQLGREAGSYFAMHMADANQLRWLQHVENMLYSNREDPAAGSKDLGNGDGLTPSSQLFIELHNQAREKGVFGSFSAFWNRVTGRRSDTADNYLYQGGFVKEAVKVWREAQAQIAAEAMGSPRETQLSSEVIQRLRESERRYGEKADRLGYETGRRFAMDMATPDQLELLQDILERCNDSGLSFSDYVEDRCFHHSCSPLQLLLGDLPRTRESDDSTIVEFLNIVNNEAHYSPYHWCLLENFVRGTVEVLKERQSQCPGAVPQAVDGASATESATEDDGVNSSTPQNRDSQTVD